MNNELMESNILFWLFSFSWNSARSHRCDNSDQLTFSCSRTKGSYTFSHLISNRERQTERDRDREEKPSIEYSYEQFCAVYMLGDLRPAPPPPPPPPPSLSLSLCLKLSARKYKNFLFENTGKSAEVRLIATVTAC